MSQQETAAPVKVASAKKQVRKEIAEKLEGALSGYKQALGEKRFASHVKKVSKLISRDLEKSGKKRKVKKIAVKKKVTKKKTTKK